MTIYADTSVLIALIADEAMSAAVRNWFNRTSERILLGDFARLEFSATVSRFIRTGRFDNDQATLAFANFSEVRSRCEPHAHSQSDYDIADRLIQDFSTKLAAPDALHLASAIAVGAALLTLDGRLADAARANGVEVVALPSA